MQRSAEVKFCLVRRRILFEPNLGRADVCEANSGLVVGEGYGVGGDKDKITGGVFNKMRRLADEKNG